MKIAKKLLAITLASGMVLTACSGNSDKNPEGENSKTKQEETKETKQEQASKFEKAGLGKFIKLGGKDLADGKGQAKVDTTLAFVGFDKDGKIVSLDIDVAQSKFDVKDDGTFVVKPQEAMFQTKKELGEKYGMKKASKIGKEWFEQIQKFEQWAIGKTVEQVMSMKLEEGRPSDSDLKSSVTIKMNGYQAAIADAWKNAVKVEGVEKIGKSVKTVLGHGTKEKSEDKGSKVQFETVMSLVAMGKDGKIVKTIVDIAQNTVEFGKDGKLMVEADKTGTTKKMLGEKYGMKKASKIGKEWFEQAEKFEEWTVGKTSQEVAGLKLEKGKATDVDLVSSVTVNINLLQEAVVNASK